jgi:MraZ protein
MMSFYGTQTYAIDHKGRISIPTSMRKAASGKRPITEFLLIASFEGCLALHSAEQWVRVEERLAKLAMGNRKARQFTRAYLKDACRVTVDGQGRITIPPALMGRAGLGKEAILHGQVGRIEIWNPERFNTETESSLRELESLGEELLGES